MIDAGGEEEVRVAHERQCTRCKGSGAAPGTAHRACPKCSGGSRLTRSQKRGTVSIQQAATCPDCRGSGSFIDNRCPACGGTGKTCHEELFTVRIPAGADEGMALRIPGRGGPAPEAGAPPGDLYVVVRTEPDPRFEHHGADPWRRVAIEVADAVLGSKVKTPTLDGEVEVDVPAGTQPDSVLRLKGKGLLHFGSETRGNLFLRIEVYEPERLSERERQFYEELRRSHRPDRSAGRSSSKSR